MKTRTIHWIFAVLALACIAALGQALLAQRTAAAFNQTLADPQPSDGVSPAAMLSRGVRLAAAGDVSAAQHAFQLALQQGDAASRRMARYNLGNLHLRQALAMRRGDVEAVPLVELAKQYYRQVLAEEPLHPDARYNLERALWLQPESVTWRSVKDKAEARERRVTASRIEPGELP
ncbi:MxaK protein [Noviherbaspirillum sp. 1P10PC]|uniref:MxaK protein n=1 Tax=Noviherbaspirillum sp. 1P10PC TaxID=3132292 RepID=UPI00399F4A2F